MAAGLATKGWLLNAHPDAARGLEQALIEALVALDGRGRLDGAGNPTIRL